MDIDSYFNDLDDSISDSDDEYFDQIMNNDYHGDNDNFNSFSDYQDNNYGDNIMFGGDKVPSFDEKNYDKGILRKCLNPDVDNIKDMKFKYVFTKDNKEVKDTKTLERISELKIPYTWGYVWISNDPKTPIQVIGHDRKGKKQYLYNKAHRKVLVEHKFGNLNLLVKLIHKLNDLIIKAKKESKGNPYDKHYILSTIIKIILLTGMRAGKEFYARTSETYGVTSLRCKHIHIKNDYVVFKFKGKSNIIHEHKITDKEIVEHIKELKKLCKNENDKIFNYMKNGEVKKIDEFTLNNYLHKYLHPKIVIKDLRTYLVNFILIQNLLEIIKKQRVNKDTKEKELKKIIRTAIKKTAEYIQHTVSVSKKNYVDPRIIKKFLINPEYFNKNINNKPSDILVDIIKDDIIVDE